jgi:hypothetical protein
MADTPPDITTTQSSIITQITKTPVSSSGDNTTVQPKPDFIAAWTEPESAATLDNPPLLL